jgi:DNA sulfur modification protein DndD
MYLSRLHLSNWRSYADATFDFKRPTERRPVTLIGAMNGGGKTSFLIALYLGLFGRFGLRHCEGFRSIAEDDISSYRKALAKFRRNVAEADEPTRIELTFTPTLNDRDEDEVRITRQWWFTGANQPKPGETFEELVIQIGERMVRASDPTLAQEKIEKALFPAHITPAFFFDGEQAQALIETSGDAGIQRAVEVMFGSKVVAELAERMQSYLQKAHANAGGKRRASEKQTELNGKITRRNDLNLLLAKRQGDLDQLETDRTEREQERAALTEKLTRLGGSPNADVRKIQDDFSRCETERREAERALIECTRRLGLPLAVSRFESSLRIRLEAEERLEAWEGLKNGTLAKEDQVMAIAIPEPPESDPLLGNLSATTRANVRARFAKALEAIYNPKETLIKEATASRCADGSCLCVAAAKRHEFSRFSRPEVLFWRGDSPRKVIRRELLPRKAVSNARLDRSWAQLRLEFATG